jgi:replication initiation protein RepC
MVAEAGDILAQITHTLSSFSEEMHGTAAHFGRHHTNSNQDSTDFEPCLETGRAADREALDPDPDQAVSPEDRTLPTPPLYLIVKACPDIQPYAKGDLTTWRELVATAAFLRGMMGISLSAWEEACHVMGAETAATVVVAMLQKIGSITNPGGYLRALSAKAALGGFLPGPMIMALLNGAKS